MSPLDSPSERSCPTDHSDAGPVRVLLCGLAPPSAIGVASKMEGLAGGFQRLGCKVSVAVREPEGSDARWLADQIEETDPELLFLRSDHRWAQAASALVRFRRGGGSLVVEVPTPISADLPIARSVSGKAFARLLASAGLSTVVWSLANVLVEYAADGIPWRGVARSRRLRISNGVDVSSRPIHGAWRERSTLRFLLAATRLIKYQASERLIRGLKGHSSELMIVGEGPQYESLLALANSLSLADQVHFQGPLTGDDFAQAIEWADVGVGPLGEHLRGLSASTLKVRDYLARGMPILISGDDPDLRDDLPFVFRPSATLRPVDTVAVGRWLSGLRESGTTPQSIREFAKARLDWKWRAAAILRSTGFRGLNESVDLRAGKCRRPSCNEVSAGTLRLPVEEDTSLLGSDDPTS